METGRGGIPAESMTSGDCFVWDDGHCNDVEIVDLECERRAGKVPQIDRQVQPVGVDIFG
jgi:hypothetical protein